MEFPQVGENFEGRYELRRVLGKGSFATVFLATDREMSRDVVIKALMPVEGEYPQTVAARFAREARVFTQLQDPHNITVYDVGQSTTGVLYMVFEYVEGRELAALLKERGSLDPPIVAHIITQLLQALREAHELGILHRDIKPANVLIYEYDGDPFRVKLLDFGIAKELRPNSAKLTRTGHVIGTLRYMAPEQIVGEPVSAASDLYSLGLVGFELLCGVPAIAGKEQRDILQNQVARDRLSVPPQRGPAGLRSVLERMMEREPAARYPSANAALHDLVAIRDEVVSWSDVVPVQPSPSQSQSQSQPHTAPHLRRPAARPTSTASASGIRRVQRSRWWAVGIAVGAALLGIAAGLLLWPQTDETARRVAVPAVRTLQASPVIERSEVLDVGAPIERETGDGCGRQPPFVGTGTMSSSTFGDRFAAYIPTNYDPERRYPLVLMFHRNLRDGRMVITQTGMDEIAEKYGAILVAPTSSNQLTWPDDVFVTVEELLSSVPATLCIDPARRYAFGDNGGASLVRRLMCTYPFSAAAFAFNGVSLTCEPVVATARLKIYGRRDRNVPMKGGAGCNPLDGRHSAAELIESRWKDQLQCRGRSRTWGKFPGGACEAYTDCGIAPLVTCATDGAHQWPGTEPTLQTAGCVAEDPEVEFPHAEAIWQFFEEFGTPLDVDDGGAEDAGHIEQ